ncbi:MAG: hypothetical protein LBK59_10395 [Bifidobacteriaceae bacterium]|nr:hypothetical protein [Bifidobacteriaceae bacterium]
MLAVVVALNTAACTGRPVGPLEPSLPTGSAADIAEATGGYFQGHELVADTYIAVYEDCLCEQGFCEKYGVTTSVSGDFEAAEKARPHVWWGVSRPEFAEKYGYREVPDMQWVTEVKTTHQPETEEYRQALFGDEEDLPPDEYGGCIGHAEDVIFGGGVLTRHEEFVVSQEVMAELAVVSRRDPNVAGVAAEWSECMAAEGYEYADPHEAYAQFVTSSDGYQRVLTYVRPRLEDDERRIAVADATCKETVGFWDVVYTAEDAAEVTVAESMRTDIDKVKATHALYVENALAAVESLDAD